MKGDICIVGGGTAGWFAAAYLSRQFPDKKIILVESKNVPKIGVGESVTPHVVDFVTHELGLDERKWMKETGAIFKLGNRFIDWCHKGHSEYFSFTYAMPERFAIGKEEVTNIDDMAPDGSPLTTDVFLDLYNKGYFDKFDKFFHSQYNWMDKQKFHEDNIKSIYGVSHHINADETTEYVKNNIGIPNGVIHIEDDVIDVGVKEDRVSYIDTKYHSRIESDYFVDSTGFKRLLISKLNVKTKDYNYPINKAIVGRSEYTDPSKEMKNYTQSIAEDWGWSFKVTLNQRVGNGFCFSDAHVSDTQAWDFFTSKFKAEPRFIKWNTDRLEEPCKGNVICVGLSNGFIEPLEANNLFIIVESILSLGKFLKHFYKTGNEDHESFNLKTKISFDNIRDFLLVHYTLVDKDRSEFWKDMCDIGVKENHVDYVYEKYKDKNCNMIAAINGETLFPEYMWLQFAISWGLDVSKWVSKKSTYSLTKAFTFFNSNYMSNYVLSSQYDNYYKAHNKWIQ